MARRQVWQITLMGHYEIMNTEHFTKGGQPGLGAVFAAFQNLEALKGAFFRSRNNTLSPCTCAVWKYFNFNGFALKLSAFSPAFGARRSFALEKKQKAARIVIKRKK